MTALALAEAPATQVPAGDEVAPFLLHPAAPPTPASPDLFHARVDGRHLLAAVRDVTAAQRRGNPAVPVLGMLHLQPTPGGLQVTSYDYEVAVRRTIPAAMAAGGACLVSPSWLLRVARDAGAGSVVLARGVDAEGIPQLVVSDGYVRRHVQVMAAAEFPDVPELDAPRGRGVVTVGTFPWGVLQHLVRVAGAAARDETPPVLTCVHLTTVDGVLRAEATDRYRLAMAETARPGVPDGVDVLLQAETLRRLLTRFGKGENITLTTLPSRPQAVRGLPVRHLLLSTLSGAASLPVMDGQYPPLQKLLPSRDDWVRAVLVDRRALLTLVERVTAGSSRWPMALTVTDDQLVLTTNAGGYESTEAYFRPLTSWQHVRPDAGVPFRIAFNGDYMADALRHFDHDVVEVGFSVNDKGEPTRPALLHGVHLDDGPPTRGSTFTRPAWTDQVDTTSTHLLMPTRLAGSDR